MFAIKGNDLLWDGEVIGPKTALFLDPQECRVLTKKQGVMHKRLPNQVDGLMVDDGDGVVIIESKKPEDLRNSHLNRRLARQLRTAMLMGDKVLLLIRPVWTLYTVEGRPNYPLFIDMARWQKMGIYDLPGPMDDEDLPLWLFHYKKILAEDTTSTAKALIGVDTGVDHKEPLYLVKSIKGVGPLQLKVIKKWYNSPWDFLVANDEELKAKGIRANVISERRKALMGDSK